MVRRKFVSAQQLTSSATGRIYSLIVYMAGFHFLPGQIKTEMPDRLVVLWGFEVLRQLYFAKWVDVGVAGKGREHGDMCYKIFGLKSRIPYLFASLTGLHRRLFYIY